MTRLFVSVCLLLACNLVALGQQDSPPVIVPIVSLPDLTYIGMPIWMDVQSPTGHAIHYPSSTTPNDFDCYEVEITQNGHLLQPRIGYPPSGRNGPPCGWLGIEGITTSRLPIHLQYPLTSAGTYMVRFTRREYRREPPLKIVEQSDWVPLHLRSAPARMVNVWLTRELAMLNSPPGQLLGDVLPSLLASHDPRVIKAMIDMSYDGKQNLVAEYAANGLALFDPAEVRARLLPTLRKRGPNNALAWLFSSAGDLALPIALEIVTASFQRLHSPDPVEVEAAVHVLSTFRDPHFRLPNETVARIDLALQEEVDFLISQQNEKAAGWISNFLGSTRPANGQELLWRLIGAGLAREQSLICITWFQEPSELARLTEILKQYDPADPHGATQASVVMDMQTQYGVSARPYLRDILASSKQTWVRVAAAKGLVQMDDRAGWEFFLETVKERPFYKAEMVRWL
jgi:hypothetical protein